MTSGIGLSVPLGDDAGWADCVAHGSCVMGNGEADRPYTDYRTVEATVGPCRTLHATIVQYPSESLGSINSTVGYPAIMPHTRVAPPITEPVISCDLAQQ